MQALENFDPSVEPTPATERRGVQHNALAEARYRLSLRAQKLLIRLIAELDHNSSDIPDVTLSLADFAALAAQERNDVTYAHFCETAGQFLGRYVAITQPRLAGEEKPRQLLCHWISSAEENPNDKSITFSFDRKLRPYLVGFKHTYFVYQTLYAFNLGSAYGIRLYQWAKSREYLKRPQQITVDELRLSLGTIEFDGGGKVVKESLKRYADLNRVAIQPAMREINDKTDISIAFREIKRPGTKIVASLVFTVRAKDPSAPQLKGMAIPLRSQFELFEAEVPKVDSPATDLTDAQDLLRYLTATFQLNHDQEKKIAGYIKNRGIEYVREKLTLTGLEPRDNVARFFMAALRDDWKLPVRLAVQTAKPKRRLAPPIVEQPQSDEERLAATEEIRRMKKVVAVAGNIVRA
jgi:plasmid replication initiation protein